MKYYSQNEYKNYYTVFDKNYKIRYGIASEEEVQKIREKFPDKYDFEKFDDFITSENISRKSIISNHGLDFHQIIMIVFLIFLAVMFIFGLIWPEQYSLIQLNMTRGG